MQSMFHKPPQQISQSFYSIYSHQSIFLDFSPPNKNDKIQHPKSVSLQPNKIIEPTQVVVAQKVQINIQSHILKEIEDGNNKQSPFTRRISEVSLEKELGSNKLIKIAQSSFNLDEGLLDIQQGSSQTQRKSFQTLRTINYSCPQPSLLKREPIPQQNKEIESPQAKVYQEYNLSNLKPALYPEKYIPLVQQIMQPHNISQIKPSQINQPLQQSVHLIKEINCLSLEKDRIRPEELKQIKGKIQTLCREQYQLQSSLNIANQLLRHAKTRNQILQLQVASYRKNEQLRQQRNNRQPISSPTPSVNTKLQPKLQLIKQSTPAQNQQKRQFNQYCKPDSPNKNQQSSTNISNLSRLKMIYKECSIKESFCIYQNQRYKIQVFYVQDPQRDSQARELVLTVKLTPHHHILSRKQFKFGMELNYSVNNMRNVNINQFQYQGVTKVQQFKAWPQSKFHIQTIIHQYDQQAKKHHAHSILVPLPITHFFEPRFMFVGQNPIKNIKKSLSQYSISLTGSVSMSWMEKLREMWWLGKFVSILGWNQVLLLEAQTSDDNNAQKDPQIRIKVFGMKGSNLITGVIQYLSFFLNT